MASFFLSVEMSSSVRSSPVFRYLSEPMSEYSPSYSKEEISETASRTLTPAAMTSFPMPSPGMIAMCFRTFPP